MQDINLYLNNFYLKAMTKWLNFMMDIIWLFTSMVRYHMDIVATDGKL